VQSLIPLYATDSKYFERELKKQIAASRPVNFSGFENPVGFGILQPKSHGIQDGIRDFFRTEKGFFGPGFCSSWAV